MSIKKGEQHRVKQPAQLSLAILLTSWAVVSSVFSELSKTVKVPLAVVTGKDRLVIQVIFMIAVIAVIMLLLFSIFSTSPLTILRFSVRCRDI